MNPNPLDASQGLTHIQIAPSMEEILRLGVVFLDSLSIGKGNPRIKKSVEDLGEELRRSIGDRRPSELEVVARSRRLFKQVGIDPTKERPSSERLLRRVLRGGPFPAVNDFVDAMNLVSLRLQFPLAYYDWDRVVPPVLLRIGRPDEGYPGIGGGEVRLQGKFVLVDGEGPFGSPTRDSERTCITHRSARALVIAFAPADAPRAALEEVLREIQAAAREFCGGRTLAAGLMPA